MFWTVVAPELILAWAVRQWFAAWEIRDTVNGAMNVASTYSDLESRFVFGSQP